MRKFVIGLDGGGTKTEAVVMDERMRIIGRGRGGPSNLHSTDMSTVRTSLADAMQMAAKEAGVNPLHAAAVTWALAGAGRTEEKQYLSMLQAEMLPGVPGQVVTDAQAALMGGIGQHFGIVLISGTGMNVYGEKGKDLSARAGGWGYMLDEGSGYSIALEGIRAAVRGADGSDLPTRLTLGLVKAIGLKDASQFVNWLYEPDRSATEIASLAPIVLKIAEEGDIMATGIVMRSADALAAHVDAVAHRLGYSHAFPLVVSGSLVEKERFFRNVVFQAVLTRTPGAQPRLPYYDAAVGAGLLALESLGYEIHQFPVRMTPNDEVWASERRNVITMDLDTRPTIEVVGLMHLEDARAVASVRPNLPIIARAIEAIAGRMEQGGRLIYVGAGTSGRLGVLDASEIPPTFNSPPGQVIGIIAGGERALRESVEEAEDHPEEGAEAVRSVEVGSGDSVVGIAASGRTPYVIGALKEAKRRGALTVALICNLPAPLAEIADYVIAPLVGPEVIAGSTRLKAGTVQKLVLNMLSTGVMVRLGKTYSNLMVDVQQLNAKLQARARRIVAQACNISEEEAAKALERSYGDAKTAIVSTLLNCSPEEASRRLKQANGRVRDTIQGCRRCQ